LSQDFRGMGRPWGIVFGFYKTRHILLSDSANCTVLRAVVLTQYQRVADRETDGIAASIAARCKNATQATVDATDQSDNDWSLFTSIEYGTLMF